MNNLMEEALRKRTSLDDGQYGVMRYLTKHLKGLILMNYDDEFEILAKWFRQKTREYLETPYERGYLDSEATAQYHKDTAEYNRRLDALNKKYGILTSSPHFSEGRMSKISSSIS